MVIDQRSDRTSKSFFARKSESSTKLAWVFDERRDNIYVESLILAQDERWRRA